MLFQAYSNYSVNLLTPVLSLMMPLFYALQLLILLYSYLSLYPLSKFFVLIYQKMVQELKYFSFPINVGFISFSFILFLLILFIYLCIKIIRKERKKSIAVEVIMISILMIRTFPIQLKKNQISFINVGQGDATLIENDGVNILVDTGGLSYVNVAEDVLIPYFKKTDSQFVEYHAKEGTTLFIIELIFIYLTYFPLKLDIFVDELNKKTGISNLY